MTESSQPFQKKTDLTQDIFISLALPLPLQIANVVRLVHKHQAEPLPQEDDLRQTTENTADAVKPGLLSRVSRWLANLPEDLDHTGSAKTDSLGITKDYYQYQGETIKIETVKQWFIVYEAYRFMNQDKVLLQKLNKTKISINWFATQAAESNWNLKQECNPERYSKEHVRRIIRTMKYFDDKKMLEPIRQQCGNDCENDHSKI